MNDENKPNDQPDMDTDAMIAERRQKDRRTIIQKPPLGIDRRYEQDRRDENLGEFEESEFEDLNGLTAHSLETSLMVDRLMNLAGHKKGSNRLVESKITTKNDE
jgi:hypothetical protein